MAYNKHTWIPQELITSDKLNNMESGIYDNINSIKDISDKVLLNDQFPNIDTAPTNVDYWSTRVQVRQDSTVIGNQLWSFDGNTADHTTQQNIDIRDLSQPYSATGAMVQLESKKHTLGHVNGVDFINGFKNDYIGMNTTVKGYLVAYNGSGLPPEIMLFKDVTTDTANLLIENSTNIVFNEGSKKLDGDGSVSFFGNYKTLAMTRVVDSTHIGIRIVQLGTGANDFSDKTTTKNDYSSWGIFVSGKTNFEYNGTAKILKDYIVNTKGITGSNQPQGQTFYKGSLYMATGFTNSQALRIDFVNGIARIGRVIYPDIPFVVNGEPEGLSIYNGKLIITTNVSVKGSDYGFNYDANSVFYIVTI